MLEGITGMLESFFHIPTDIEVAAVIKAGSAFNASGVVAWAFIKIFFVIYILIGIVLFFFSLRGEFKNAYKTTYGNPGDDKDFTARRYEKLIRDIINESPQAFIAFIFIWPGYVFNLVKESDIDINLSGWIARRVDKKERKNHPENYI